MQLLSNLSFGTYTFSSLNIILFFFLQSKNNKKKQLSIDEVDILEKIKNKEKFHL